MNYVKLLNLNIFMRIIYRYILIFIDRLFKMRHFVLISTMKIEKVREFFLLERLKIAWFSRCIDIKSRHLVYLRLLKTDVQKTENWCQVVHRISFENRRLNRKSQRHHETLFASLYQLHARRLSLVIIWRWIRE
jgi:hypothetical protein